MHQVVKSRHWLMALILTVATLTQVPVQAAQPSLLNSVTEELGISQQQASAALGSLFQLAQKGMKKSEFSQLAALVPDMSGLLESAPKVKSSSASQVLGSLGGLGGSLGKASSSAGNMAMLHSTLSQLGLDPELSAPLIETVYSYVQSEGGQALLNKLKQGLSL